MTTGRLGAMLLVLSVFVGTGEGADRRTEHVLLVTLDGARWQEIFSGLDENLVRATAPTDSDASRQAIYLRFSGSTPEERRAKLMPFLWNTLVRTHGVLAGDRNRGSQVSVTNRHWFSYPGYSEILTGQAHDDTIKSNDPVRNPYPSVLQFLRRKLNVDRDKVAVFGSWNVFRWIAESREGDIAINAGLERYDGGDGTVRVLNDLMFETAPPWDGVRHDVYTLRFALDYLRRATPRVLYIAFDETDEWAHGGRYDRVLDSLHRTDGYLREIWDTLQQHPSYRGRTSLVVTVDHGRGKTDHDWRNHGSKVPGADEIWFAIASPDVQNRGEWHDHPPLFQNQIAATLAAFLGFDYREQNPEAGEALQKHLLAPSRSSAHPVAIR